MHIPLGLALLICDAEFNKRNLDPHYERHGKEFGLTKEEYAKLAKELTEQQLSKGVIEYKRIDKSRARYNLRTNVLVIWYPSINEVATMFKPKYDPRTHEVKLEASKEYVRRDMIKNGKKPPF